MAKDVKRIVEEYLRANGYDGLFSTSYDCGCRTGDLAPCDCESILYCEPGYFMDCPPECEDHEFHIGEFNDPEIRQRIASKYEITVKRGEE